MKNLRFFLLTAFLAASVKAASVEDCGCTAKTKTYGVGEIKISRNWGKISCSNLEEVADVVERCEGADGSFSQINNEHFNVTKSCADKKKLGCGFKTEMRNIKFLCTKKDGTSKELDMTSLVSNGCRCQLCEGGLMAKWQMAFFNGRVSRG